MIERRQFFSKMTKERGRNQAVDIGDVFGRMHSPELSLQPGPVCNRIVNVKLREMEVEPTANYGSRTSQMVWG